jgi:hypothetical protein
VTQQKPGHGQVAIRNLAPARVEYFEACARIRDITVTRLFERLVEIIADDCLVQSILDDDSTPCREKGKHRYRPKVAAHPS